MEADTTVGDKGGIGATVQCTVKRIENSTLPKSH